VSSISIDFPYLASSPDGLLSQDDIIEVKCPYVSRDKPINENTVPFLKCNTKEQYYLEPTHNYYYQIQGQLLCTGQKECTLIVCHADHLKVNDIKYVTVPRYDDFIACIDILITLHCQNALINMNKCLQILCIIWFIK
jgi:hypothetical protein